MQRLIKNGAVVNDSWHVLDKDATLDGLPNSDSIIVPLALWLEHSHALKARDGGLGEKKFTSDPIPTGTQT